MKIYVIFYFRHVKNFNFIIINYPPSPIKKKKGSDSLVTNR